MYREHTRLGPESKQDTYTGSKDSSPASLSAENDRGCTDSDICPDAGCLLTHSLCRGKFDCALHIRKVQSADSRLHEKEAHKKNKTADDRNKKICIGSAYRALRLLVNDPCERGERQDLKEYERRHEVCREHDTLRCSQSQDDEQPVAGQSFPLAPEVFPGEQRSPCPHHGCNDAVD